MEEQGLVVVKENFLYKLSHAFKHVFRKSNNLTQLPEKSVVLNQEEASDNTANVVEFEHVDADTQFVQKEILDARRAFRKYVIKNNKNISKDVLLFVNEKFQENKSAIEQLIVMNNDDISYDELTKMVENEIKEIVKKQFLFFIFLYIIKTC